MPWFVPNQHASGICRFYLQEVAPNFRLYVSPINIDPSAPAVQMSEPASFVKDVSKTARACSTRPAFRKITSPHERHLRRRRISQAGQHGARRTAGAVRIRRRTITTTACCSSISPAAICSRTCSGGIPTKSIRPARRRKRRSISATFSGCISGSTKSSATSSIATAARRRSS